MDDWKKFIMTGNQHFSCNDFEAAKLEYEIAQQHAEQLFPKWRDPEEAASALVVTYHNIADLHQKQGHTQLARAMFEKAHKALLHAVVSTPIENERHSALLRASVKTYSALLIHKKCYSDSLYH